jgi:hypothetical protein
LRLIHAAAKRQHRTSPSLPAGNGSVADPAIVAGFDRVLESVEGLRQETFQSEAGQAAQTEASANVAWGSHPRKRSTLRILIERLRFSSRAPYRQIREAVSWSFLIIGVVAIVWVVLIHLS